ncbi:MAG: nucleoside triphosphate pyrophosphohydrolase [Rhodobacteraceae bacterium]|nr:nucleoside triphosphate pyrophosphohydrolase [Paracoccaceae bacterium]
MVEERTTQQRAWDPKLIQDESKGLDRLIAIMRRLRDPDGGCPWDLQQSFDSIAPYTIEEAYEVADAIERGDMADLRDELGDLLLQVVYHAQIADEGGKFDFHDVAVAVSDKMVRRHPHVFDGADSFDWEGAKAAEREAKRAAKGEAGPPSLLEDVPAGLPALLRAVKLQKRAARVGFDWDNPEQVLDKVAEETSELVEARDQGESPQRVAEEFGDLLFAMANVARHLNIDPETALRAANAKFSRRFRYIEQRLAAEGRTASEADLAEMEALWAAVKAEEKQQEKQ